MEPISIFLIVGLSFSFLLLLKRLTHSNWKSPGKILPAILIALITIELFYGWLYSSGMFRNLPHLIRLNTPIVFLIGPGVFLLIKSIGNPTLRWKDISYLHLLPFFLAIAYFIPFYASSATDKIIYVENMFNKLPIDSLIIGGLRRIHQGIYYTATAFFIFRRKEDISFLNELKSSVIIISVFSLLWMISVYRYFFQFDFETGYIDISLLGLVSIVLVYRQLSNPEKRKQLATLISRNDFENHVKSIILILENEQLYLNPRLTLQQLAKKLDIPYPVISRTINQEMKTNFNELVNSYRVKEAIRLLQSPQINHLTIEAIAEKSGFNSSSSFNHNFKKIAGRPPKYFKARLETGKSFA